MSHSLTKNVRSESSLGIRLTKIFAVLSLVVVGAATAKAAEYSDWPRDDYRSNYGHSSDYSTYKLQAPDDRLDRGGSYRSNYDESDRYLPLRTRGRDPNEFNLDRSNPVDFDGRRFPSVPERYREVPSTKPAPVSKEEELSNRITARYSNPMIVRFLRSVSAEQALSLYVEASQLIDSRHLKPTTYDERLRQAELNLMAAVQNQAFLQAVNASANRQQVSQFQTSLQQITRSRSVRNANETVAVIRQVMNMASQTMRISQTAVALEFVYASTETLDKYSAFEPEENKRQPSASALDEQVVGIGVEVKIHEQGVRILKPLRGGPAEQAGLLPEDIIVSINGRSIAGQSLDAIVDQIGGREGTALTLGIVRNGQAARQVQLTRRTVKIYSVSEVTMLGGEEKVGYIKLDKFASTTDNEVDQALWSLHQKGMKSLVIDLRGNPGGLLTTAISLSDKFLPSGTIVSTRGRNASDNSMEQARYEQTWNVPLVVVVDENSASASEIFAAAIQENDRGVIVGTKSYGKGTVQTHFPLRSVSGNLRLTTANFYSPKGRVMADSGVTPDLPVSAMNLDRYTTGDRAIEMALRVAKAPQLKELATRMSTRPNGV